VQERIWFLKIPNAILKEPKLRHVVPTIFKNEVGAREKVICRVPIEAFTGGRTISTARGREPGSMSQGFRDHLSSPVRVQI
jgi:hypothetical protein